MPSSRRRNAPIGVSRSAGRVARSSSVSALAERRFASVRLSGSVVLIVLRPPGLVRARESRNDQFVPGRKVVPSAVPPSFGEAALRDRRASGRSCDRCRSALPSIAGALRRSLLGSRRVAASLAVRSGGSRVHSLSSSLRFPPATGSLCRRSTGTRPVHRPFFVMSAEDRRVAARASSADGREAPLGGKDAARTHGRREIPRRRPAEVEPLAEIAAEGGELFELGRCLDALADRRQAEPLGERDDRRRDRLLRTGLLERDDERPVDLDDVDRQAGEVAQGRVAGPEVVDREPDAERG